MKTCRYYWFIEPLRPTYGITSDRIPVLELPLRHGSKSLDFGLFADENGFLEYAELRIPHLSGNEIPEELAPLIQAHSEHLLSILKLTYRPDINLYRHTLGFWVDDDIPFNTVFGVSQIIGDASFDPDKTREVFEGTFSHREEIRLLVDSHDERIPLQYRYLALYKVLEFAFKTGNRWEEEKLKAFLEPYQTSFKQLQIAPKSLEKYIHELRDRCAHIRTGSTGRRQMIGVTELNQREAARVGKILPLLSEICVALINDRADGEFAITPRRQQPMVKYNGRVTSSVASPLGHLDDALNDDGAVARQGGHSRGGAGMPSPVHE